MRKASMEEKRLVQVMQDACIFSVYIRVLEGSTFKNVMLDVEVIIRRFQLYLNIFSLDSSYRYIIKSQRKTREIE
jgi:hypothetical protein